MFIVILTFLKCGATRQSVYGFTFSKILKPNYNRRKTLHTEEIDKYGTEYPQKDSTPATI